MPMTNRRLPKEDCRHNQHELSLKADNDNKPKETRDEREGSSREQQEKRSEILLAWCGARVKVMLAERGDVVGVVLALGVAGALWIVAWRDPSSLFLALLALLAFQYFRDTRSSRAVDRVGEFDETPPHRWRRLRAIPNSYINEEVKNGDKNGNRIEHNEHISSSREQRAGDKSRSSKRKNPKKKPPPDGKMKRHPAAKARGP